MARKSANILANWDDGITAAGAWGNIPTLPGCGPTIDDIESELQELVHLDADIREEDDKEVTHECRDARGQTAVEHIQRIPDALQCVHLICSGKYALWDMVPATLHLAYPAKITALHIATLGFSKLNVADMANLMDRGSIGTISLLCSHYFKGTSGGIWETAEAEFAKRPGRTRFLSIRTHCKILAMALSDGRRVTVESSANLRSCKNIEQMTIFGHPAVHDFHTGWMDHLFQEAGQ